VLRESSFWHRARWPRREKPRCGELDTEWPQAADARTATRSPGSATNGASALNVGQPPRQSSRKSRIGESRSSGLGGPIRSGFAIIASGSHHHDGRRRIGCYAVGTIHEISSRPRRCTHAMARQRSRTPDTLAIFSNPRTPSPRAVDVRRLPDGHARHKRSRDEALHVDESGMADARLRLEGEPACVGARADVCTGPFSRRSPLERRDSGHAVVPFGS